MYGGHCKPMPFSRAQAAVQGVKTQRLGRRNWKAVQEGKRHSRTLHVLMRLGECVAWSTVRTSAFECIRGKAIVTEARIAVTPFHDTEERCLKNADFEGRRTSTGMS
jgi:hypothetical protein